MENHEKIFEILFNKDEVTWQSLLYELVKTEQMDPWDINVSMLTKKYIEIIKKLKELDFRVSGKVLLAVAILLKIKSNRLLNEDLSEFDRLLTESEEELLEELDLEEEQNYQGNAEKPILIPRTPQPRKRKVSIYDLMGALEKALEVKKRRVLNSIPPMNLEIPKKPKDITQIIKEVYGRIKSFFLNNKENKLTFSKLIPAETKEDKVYTFIPLLHLTNQRKINISQEEHFGEIEIMVRSEKEVNEELGEA
ncbi:MAG: ScpA family protein [Candidatus Woesearchaeota archaeon]|jgi:segregation and condensation protein A|nr:ScpA family protein [Candidatus Woesearchaeota archaeon]MDP7622566.1 ScpA family protein [Candidatus Woesearchaeota archaeon]HJN57278.1 ScpA family protein [Candidatus Woesearchaeota archaeon]|tara:strand:+ start:9434 stop:10186 length:753 start_codon:yes stop_codon:yes gene_type:complete